MAVYIGDSEVSVNTSDGAVCLLCPKGDESSESNDESSANSFGG